MRILVAAVFALVGVPLLASAFGTLAAAPAVDQQAFAMMQVIAGLLCILIAVVAGLVRPSARAPEAPRRAAQAAAAPPRAARDRAGLGPLVVGLAVILIVLATWLRKAGHERDARALIPMPASGSAPGPARPTAPAVLPTGGTDSRRSGAKAHASKARPARDDHQ
ncbi:MAG TPA: hypothetical protein VGF29_05945 [Hyphomicrobiaceae bacterium]|jgi:uncharacterized protein YjeT (DUF2065 family)